MAGFGLTFSEYLSNNRADIVVRVQQHALLSLYTILCAAVIGVGLAILVHRRRTAANFCVATAAVGFTLPSVAVFGILFSLVGGNLLAVFPPLVMYAVLPILRNSVVGLQSVDEDLLDAARGMGMNRFRRLWQVELPTAWPVILAGLRVSAQLTVGIVTIAAFVVNMGLGYYGYASLDNLGSANTGNEALVCVLFVALIALAFDALFVVVRRLTMPRGIRV
ncbi:ABC transporter permease [Streptomyces sp. S3(2020)]|uniref:ABC transporter permease n=1 Tax=Streptomyces sp. S3(2020) TaxID=2732044 RepID=UPI0014887FC8|nr:ABC transporter permease [Streptomyces sp. S3(2020)]NNN33807.1 ABC transporter permease [Streptomyces sp. S3(2020)]